MKSEIAGTVVEWDENKKQQNIKKHGISFQTAALVFADEERIEYYDKKHSVDEYGYRAYSFVIMHTIPIRIGLKKFILKVQRILSEEDEEN